MGQLTPDIILNDKVHSAAVLPGRNNTHTVHLDVENLGALQAFMLVDLSDIKHWPHVEADHLHLESVHMHFNPNATFSGDIVLGWLSAVDGTEGTINSIHAWHFALDKVTMTDHLNWDWIQPLAAFGSWFGPSEVSGLFRTGVSLYGPDKRTAYPSGDGDLVLMCKRTAGNIDIGCTVCYATDPEPEVEEE